jgi:ATP-dependent RNA helicase RhlE
VAALARGVDILVATPGRLLDHIAERNIVLSATEVFVLDEADQMLDLGFLPPIRRIVSHLPRQRQNLFCSATMPGEIGRLAADLLRDPVKVAVAPVATTVETVTQRVIHVESRNKRAILVELLADRAMARTLVFTRTKRGADRVARHLDQAGIRAAAIHGNKSQVQREKALAAFRAARVRALVATDIAARGIDVDDVTHVVNFELPDVPESYVHRIGRTARAGSAGAAISLCDAEERDLLRDIERLIRQAIPAEDRRQGGGRQPERAGAGDPGRANGGVRAVRQGKSHHRGRAKPNGRGQDFGHGQHRPGEKGDAGNRGRSASGQARHRTRRPKAGMRDWA